MQFMSQACVEEMDLLAAQLSLEEKANSKSWGRSSQRFLGLPLVTTLVKLLELGEVREADELRMRMKVTDKRYWRIKIRGLANAGNFEELNAFAIVTSPIGYEVFVETFLFLGLFGKIESDVMIYFGWLGARHEFMCNRYCT